jgi:hypothetical protein
MANSTANNIYILRRFEPNPDGDGGSKRTYQIDYLLRQWLKDSPYLTLVPVEIARKGRKLKTWLQYLAFCLSVDVRSAIQKFFFQKQSLINGYYFYLAVRQIPENATVFWESVYPDYYFVVATGKYKWLALPHNLESLVPHQALSGFSNNIFHNTSRELTVLRACTASATISYEEHWLQSLHGVNSYYLPYFPVGEIAVNCKKIVDAKGQNTHLPYAVLINGSATNPPTLAGMRALLAFLHRLSSTISFYVCGFGTEQLAEYESSQIHVLGGVTQERLNDLYHICSIAIVNQGFSSGVLTKIPELLGMGIPVLACQGSSRSFYGHSSVYTYQNFEHLLALLETRPTFQTYHSTEVEQLRYWHNFFNTYLLSN